jgi:hypothetical protein
MRRVKDAFEFRREGLLSSSSMALSSTESERSVDTLARRPNGKGED